VKSLSEVIINVKISDSCGDFMKQSPFLVRELSKVVINVTIKSPRYGVAFP